MLKPFQFVINNEKLETTQQEDFETDVLLVGSKVPNNIYIEMEGNRFSLIKNDMTNFKFCLKMLFLTLNSNCMLMDFIAKILVKIDIKTEHSANQNKFELS